MTSAPSLERQTAAGLRGILRELFDLSLEQAEALAREDDDRLESLLERKSALLPQLDRTMAAMRARGWKLTDPAAQPADSGCAALLREAMDLSRKLQAHERYVLGQMLARRNLIGGRLDAIMMKRQAAAGYRAPAPNGATIDTAR